ncbi:kinase domain protein [Ceratobasidium sp. AG-Ba]|nr:kinase domain protein [Ceratobasidium sp. AG-Ba]
MLIPRSTRKLFVIKGDHLGSGGYGIVYRAKERDSDRSFAIKKSRVSLRVNRTLLQHEARVLRFLSGHPAIPEVYAYGRTDHFELLSLELLERSLSEVVKESGSIPITTVLEIADQMLNVISYMHNKGLVHRDIKPQNILLKTRGASRICLIDFGLAYRPQPKNGAPKTGLAQAEPTGVCGTAVFSSIKSHESSDLTFRDDLESLGLSLIFLLRGDLPWSHYLNHGSVRGRLRQVYEQKKIYNGQRLAHGLPSEFGQLIDYARSLSDYAIPDYDEWRRRFRQCSKSIPAPASASKPQIGQTPPVIPFSYSPPFKRGQVVIARILCPLTVEGYSSQVGHENSYIHDLSLLSQEWTSAFRPGIVISVKWDERAKLHYMTLIPISRHQSGSSTTSSLTVPIVGKYYPSSDGPEPAIYIEPEWPFQDSYCYTFQDPAVFYCLTSPNPPPPARWKTGQLGVKCLNKILNPKRGPFGEYEFLNSTNPDIRHDARIRRGHVKVYAEVHPLLPEHLEDNNSVEWFSHRAWFDEYVKVCQRRDWDNGVWWSRSPIDNKEAPNHWSGFSDSYRGNDYSLWDRQQERDKSITLSTENLPEGNGGVDELDEVVLIE